MKHYQVLFRWLAPYPKLSSLYRVQASNISAAIGKAHKIWRKDNKGHKITGKIIVEIEKYANTNI